VAPLGQILLNDIAGWPLLISFAVRTAVGRMAVTPPVRLASVRGPFFPSLAAAAMVEKKSGELSSGPHRPAR
jgi:hypothetical protein